MLLRRQVNEERDEHIDMTPMVDVVFQLMTFMLFSVQIANSAKVEVPTARHGGGVEGGGGGGRGGAGRGVPTPAPAGPARPRAPGHHRQRRRPSRLDRPGE